jgi:hypothetical protein
MSGWDREPDYTPPNPPVWFWVLAGLAVAGVIAIGISAAP